MELIQSQLLMALFASAVIIPTIQKVKGYFPEKYVSLISGVLSFVIGGLMAMYYGNFDVVSSLWVAFFSFVGASEIYNLLSNGKLASYTAMKNTEVAPDDSVSKSE